MISAIEMHCVVVICILYHISMDDRFKSMFAFTDCIPMVCTNKAFLLVVPRVNVWVPFLFPFFFLHVAISDSVQWLPYLGLVPGPTRTTIKGLMSLLLVYLSARFEFASLWFPSCFLTLLLLTSPLPCPKKQIQFIIFSDDLQLFYIA